MFVMTCIFAMLINKSILPQIVFFYMLLPCSEWDFIKYPIEHP